MPPHQETETGIKFTKSEINDQLNSIEKPSAKKEILYKGYYYDVTNWIKFHPGGDIINYYTEKGEDATIAIGQFHHRSIKKVEFMLRSFKRRPAEVEDEVDDPVKAQRHKDLTRDFIKLFEQLVVEGVFDPSITHVALRLLDCILLGLVGTALVAFCDSLIFKILGTFILGLMSARTGFLMHEGSHNGLTGIPAVDKFIHSITFGLGNGLSGSFYTHHHHKHHSKTMTLHKDSDLETLPLLAFNKKVVLENNPKLGRGFFIQNQAVLFMAIDAFLITFYWKFYLHVKFAMKNGHYLDLFFMGVHYIFSYNLGLWPFLLSAWIGSAIGLGNIALAHLHFPLTEERLHWVEYSLMHTTNIEATWWCNYWMGYLNHQIEHHLFPTMPIYKYEKVNKRVKALALKHGLKYHYCSYAQAIKNCYNNLDLVSHELQHS